VASTPGTSAIACHAQVLDVLETGQLGALVARKRSFLDGKRATAEFTISALAKDMALLADASQTPLPSAAELAASPAAPEADIALARLAGTRPLR
jgi:hypothetical protein